MTHQVFICHASEDKPIADAVCAILEEDRVKCWIAPRDILPAGDYGEAIVESICSSRLVVFVFSANANASPHVTRELECAVSHGIPILPFRVQDVIPSESLQYYLGGIHWLDALTPPLEEHLRQLSGTVKILLERDQRALSGNRAAAALSAPPVAPPSSPPRPAVVAEGPVARGGGRSRVWMVALAGIVVIGIGVGIGVALSGGGGGGKGGTGGGTTTSTALAASPDMAMAQKACALLDPAEVKSLYGSTAGTGTPSSTDTWCDFGSSSESISISQEAATLADFTSARQGEDPGIVDLPGIGGGAYQDPQTGTLTVYDSKRGVIFVLLTGSSDAADYQRLVDLAKHIVARS